MNQAMRPRGITQGVAHAALIGPEELGRHAGLAAVVRLGSNESPFGPSPKALAAIRIEAERANRYGDPACFELREAIAARHGVPAACVGVGAGIDDLLGWAVRAYLEPGAPAIAARGAFPTFEMHCNGFGAHLERVPYRADARIDLDGFVDAATRLRGGLIFFPNPDNPSGTAREWRDVVAFVDALPPNTLVIHDEAYANFLPSQQRFPADAIDPRILRMRTFSKEYGLAGLRVGYVLGDPEAIAALDAVRLLYGVSRLAQVGAVASLRDEDFMEAVVRRIAAGRAEYYALGARLGIPTLPSTTNFVLFDFGDATRATRATSDLLAHGIHVRKPPFPPLDRYVRISVGTPGERSSLAEALSAVAADG
jgi:histidinol-phosphate aminotransferase